MSSHNHNHHIPEGVSLYQNIAVNKLPNCEVEITGEIPFEALTSFRKEALDHFKDELELPGFRKGHVPEKMVVDKIGELAILEEATEHALDHIFVAILKETKIDAIGQPRVAITKLALDNPVGFKITTAVFPEFTLPEYKKIAADAAKTKESVAVTDKEIEEAILTIRKMQSGKNATEIVKEKDLPELTDDLVKTFGNFETVADFKSKITESIQKEKEVREKEKVRLAIIQGIIAKSDIPLPRVLVEAELDRMFAYMKDDVERMGMKINEYLERIKKNEDDLRKEWEQSAQDRVKTELILGKIADNEHIEAPQEEVEKEVKHLLEHYEDADPLRAASYFSHIIKNEKVFQLLESAK